MAADIDAVSAECDTCNKFRRNNNSIEPLQSFPLTDRPWQRISTDIVRESSKDYLIAIHWLEIMTRASKTALEIIRRLESLFSQYSTLFQIW
jgi:hypothetical protein